ncbi:MAG: cytochrome c peroxidase [Chitinophagaceae bacterium]
MPFRVVFFIILFMAAWALINQGCESSNDKEKARKIAPVDLGEIAALPTGYKSPANNPSTNEKIELGRLLFFDPILSGKNDVSCASCHHPEFAYAESLQISIGVNGKGLGEKRVFLQPNSIPFTKRNSQTLLNTAFNGIDVDGNYVPEEAPMFWDLRAKSLEEQALHPIRQLEEMSGSQDGENMAVGEVIKRLKSIPEYRRLFTLAFNAPEAVSDSNLGKALASFQRSLLANNSRFDQYMRGDSKALTSSELEGMDLFIQSGCARCHNGPMLSDYKTHVMGVKDNENRAGIDSGFQNTFAFRTPSLRNLRLTYPYMHSGKIRTLDDVLTFYEDLQGNELPNSNLTRAQLDPLAKKIKLEFKNIARIVEFLNSLNDDKYDKKIPAAVPSGLSVGGNIK